MAGGFSHEPLVVLQNLTDVLRFVFLVLQKAYHTLIKCVELNEAERWAESRPDSYPGRDGQPCAAPGRVKSTESVINGKAAKAREGRAAVGNATQALVGELLAILFENTSPY